MSVLVRGMEMPLSCWNSCRLNKKTVKGNVYCPLIDVYMEKGEIGTRHPNCPLVKVKEPHGRLIDADEIEMPCLETTADQKWMEIAIKSTPTVIEAEGSEE